MVVKEAQALVVISKLKRMSAKVTNIVTDLHAEIWNTTGHLSNFMINTRINFSRVPGLS